MLTFSSQDEILKKMFEMGGTHSERMSRSVNYVIASRVGSEKYKVSRVLEFAAERLLALIAVSSF